MSGFCQTIRFRQTVRFCQTVGFCQTVRLSDSDECILCHFVYMVCALVSRQLLIFCARSRLFLSIPSHLLLYGIEGQEQGAIIQECHGQQTQSGSQIGWKKMVSESMHNSLAHVSVLAKVALIFALVLLWLCVLSERIRYLFHSERGETFRMMSTTPLAWDVQSFALTMWVFCAGNRPCVTFSPQEGIDFFRSRLQMFALNRITFAQLIDVTRSQLKDWGVTGEASPCLPCLNPEFGSESKHIRSVIIRILALNRKTFDLALNRLTFAHLANVTPSELKVWRLICETIAHLLDDLNTDQKTFLAWLLSNVSILGLPLTVPINPEVFLYLSLSLLRSLFICISQ